MAQEKKRTFTQEQAAIMYRALFILKKGFFGLKSSGYGSDILAHVDSIDSEPTEGNYYVAVQAGNGLPAGEVARYVPTVDTTRYETHKEHWRVWDTQEDMPFVGMDKPEYYELGADCQAECNRLNTANSSAAGDTADLFLVGGISTVTSADGTTMYIVNGYNFKSESAAKEYLASLNPAAQAGEADLASTIGDIQAMMKRGELNYCPIHGDEITQRIDGSHGCQECDWQHTHEMFPTANAASDNAAADTVAGNGETA